MASPLTSNPYQQNLDKNAANYVPLSPLSFLPRTAQLFPSRLAWIDGDKTCTWKALHGRINKLASMLAKRGVGRGDTVSTLMPNSYAMYECHFGIPASGAVINTLNIRLDASTIAFMLAHSSCKVLIVDYELASAASWASS